MSSPEPETSSESDDEMHAPKPVLPFSSVGVDMTTTIPLTPEQYLSQVHAQAQQLPAILTAPSSHHAPTSSFASSPCSHKRTLPPTPLYAEPCSQWRGDIKSFFSRLQDGLSTMTIKSTEKKNYKIPSSTDQWLNHFANHLPSVEFAQHLDFLSIVGALDALHETLPSHEDSPSIGLNLLRNSFIPMWIFSLLAFLPPPVDADTSALFNSLRSKFVIARSVVKEYDEEALASLNLIIVILEDHYGQR